MCKISLASLAFFSALCSTAIQAGEPDNAAAQRGKQALLSRELWPPVFPAEAYGDAWKRWGLKSKPTNYDQRFRERYGLHATPDAQTDYPMGLRPAARGEHRGIALDCLMCHSGSIAGKSYIGLPNSSFDYQALVDELTPQGAERPDYGVALTPVRGTMQAASETIAAISIRDADLGVLKQPLNLGVPANVPEDPPAWWLLRKKKTMYHTGMMSASSGRSIMIFLLDPRNDLNVFKREEKTFADIRDFLLSIEPPQYPFPVDREQAKMGRELFVMNCSECHGTYGESWTYPNRIVSLEEIGTDPVRATAYSQRAVRHFNRTWLGEKDHFERPQGYQAPPLDGVWATAPYLHNGSVPTVEHLLDSKTRPKIFTRSYNSGEEDYDNVRLGWKVEVLEKPADSSLPPIERRKVYDTRIKGQSNAGHVYGDHLTEKERRAIIEYLKTI